MVVHQALTFSFPASFLSNWVCPRIGLECRFRSIPYRTFILHAKNLSTTGLIHKCDKGKVSQGIPLSHEFDIAPEMYLKTIYNLEAKTGAARTGDIAKILQITPGSVTNTLEVLETKGFVAREPYRGVKLTPQGRQLALSVFRRHRLAERLLTDVLHFDWTESHEEACKLEHAISDRLASAMEKVLGNPKTCPHGNPIPDQSGSVPAISSEPLSTLENGSKVTVLHISDEDTEVLRYLAKLGIYPGVKIEVEQKAPFGGPMLVKVGTASHALSLDIASGIRVRKEP